MDRLELIYSKHLEEWQLLCKRWQLTTELWDDQVRQRFEREFWQSLEVEASAVHREMEALIQSVSEAQRRVQ